MARAVIVAALLVVTVAGLIVACTHNLSYSGIWFDEAVQFWVAQGQRPVSQPFTPRGGVRGVVGANRTDNLDPGGFSLLLHFWTVSNRSLEHLRLLPLAFYLLTLGALGVLGWRMTGSVVFAAAAAAVPLLYPKTLAFAFEVRAHTMEMAGIAVAAMLLVWVVERPSPGRLALLGSACAAFLTSRYSYALFISALVLVLAVFWLRQRTGLVGTAARLATMAAPVLVVAAAIFAVVLRRQLWWEMRSGAVGLSAPAYTRRSLLTLDSHGLGLLLHNLFSLPALPMTLCAIALLVRWGVWEFLAKRTRVEAVPHREAVALVQGLVVATHGASAAASLLGLYPWDLASRWSVYLLVVSALGVVALGADLLWLLRLASRSGPRARVRGAAAAYLGVAAAAAVVGAGFQVASHLHRSIESAYVTDVARQVALLPPALPARSVFVTFYEVPMVRYLFEAGRLVGDTRYPQAFRLERAGEWGKKAPVVLAGEGIAYIINALPAAELAAKFPGSVLTPVGGSRLMAVTPQSGGGSK